MSIISLSGKISSGKDTVAKMIQFHLTNEKRIARGATAVSWEAYTDPKNITVSNSRNWDESGWEVKKFAGKLKEITSLLLGIPVTDLELESVKNSELGPEWTRPWFVNAYNPEKSQMLVGVTDLEAHARRFKHLGHIELRPMTVRTFLQELGTNAMRNQVHPNIHVNALFTDYKANWTEGTKQYWKDRVSEFPNWLITDVRFPNEADAVVVREGLLVRVNRPRKSHVLVDTDSMTPAGLEGYKAFTAEHPSETALDNYRFSETIINDGSIEDLLEKVKDLLIKHSILTDGDTVSKE